MILDCPYLIWNLKKSTESNIVPGGTGYKGYLQVRLLCLTLRRHPKNPRTPFELSASRRLFFGRSERCFVIGERSPPVSEGSKRLGNGGTVIMILYTIFYAICYAIFIPIRHKIGFDFSRVQYRCTNVCASISILFQYLHENVRFVDWTHIHWKKLYEI